MLHDGHYPEREWYDYDLAGAYTTGLLDILQPDYDNIFHSRNPEDYCGHVMGFALVSFQFPDSVRFPCCLSEPSSLAYFSR
jgi:hypothetical protein